ncbi:hypothetical protein SAMN05192568_10714 [Methylobacterium pseudosasicola]|uniref:Uncharacterized protein n=1 Tax=Methylobacterium pseudosasicola TaxID=582667 RepID=A0A1I4UHI2_9HYPH|nr:hypothetical protein SAMN05192568_10714 [Methylobacterium pseudosasicola]
MRLCLVDQTPLRRPGTTCCGPFLRPSAMFAEELGCAIEVADRITLPQVTTLVRRAYGDGRSRKRKPNARPALIEARTLSADRQRAGQAPTQSKHRPDGGGDPSQPYVGSPRRAVGSRPHTDASMGTPSPLGRLGPASTGASRPLHFGRAGGPRPFDRRGPAPEGLPPVDREHGRRHRGVPVDRGERDPRGGQAGPAAVKERRITGFRNDTNVLRIISPEWQAWPRLARKGNAARPIPARGGRAIVASSSTGEESKA